MNTFSKKLLVAGVSLVAIGSLAGCGAKFDETGQDAPMSGHDDSPAKGINFPDGFSNVGFKCYGPNGIYVVYHGDGPYGAIDVVPDDKNCKK